MSHVDSRHAPALPHGPIVEVLPDIFFVKGSRQWHFQDFHWQFSRNMTVVRDGRQLTLFNAVRLDDEGLAALDALGDVANVVQVGGLHGLDDAFYRDRYSASYWAQPGAGQEGVPADRQLVEGGDLPVADASLFVFKTTRVPEAIVHLQRHDGVLIACDALQNYLAPDEFFSGETAELMTKMGFFTRANVGPVWLQAAEPGADDFARLKELPFRHVFCGHGEPLIDTAREEYAATFGRIFGV
ncbi:hypothetical protein GR183_12915 [Stappia sp. GBMRC 2046]|uniref:MBL fold metallo-hydrolase n=1 Tax=Stappia sediminis TaxID=2692190 RepID=A0A7X3LVH3_9HYPH|nr:hypothetical protein [Stappia sediminis]MXN65808.1 hypothetical protein [Stappia sediminis]